MNTLQQMTIKELAGELRQLLPDMVDYADLVGAEGSAQGCHFVYEDPQDYIIDEAAARLDNMGKTIARLNAKLTDVKETLDSIESCLAMVPEGTNDVAAKRLRFALTRMQELAEMCADEAAICGITVDEGAGYDDVDPLPF